MDTAKSASEAFEPGHGAFTLDLSGFVAGLRALGRTLRIYADDHDRVRRHLLQLERVAGHVLGQSLDPLVLTAIGGEILAGNTVVDQTLGLARALQRRGIRSVAFFRGVAANDLHALGRVLQEGSRDIVRRRSEGKPLLPGYVTKVAIEVTGAEEAQRLLDRLLGSAQIAAKVDALRAIVGDESKTASVEALLRRYLCEIGSQMLSPGALERGVTAFLERLRAHIADSGGNTITHEALSCTAWDLMLRCFAEALEGGEEGVAPDPAPASTSYDRLEKPSLAWAELASQSIRKQMAAHGSHATAFTIACELLIAARTPAERHAASAALRAAAAGNRYPADAVITGLQRVRATAGVTAATELAMDLLDHAADTNTVVEIVRDLSPQDWNDAREVIDRVCAREDATLALVRLLDRKPAEALRAETTRALRRWARRRPESWLKFGFEHAAEVARAPVILTLLDDCPEIAAPVVRGILHRGTADDRAKVIDILVADGQLRSLRLLVLGVPYGGEHRDVDLIEAVGRFRSPLAVAVLREAVMRCNTMNALQEEGVRALRALSRNGSRDAVDFLHEVARQRCLGMPVYRRYLRSEARKGLSGEEDAS